MTQDNRVESFELSHDEAADVKSDQNRLLSADGQLKASEQIGGTKNDYDEDDEGSDQLMEGLG